MSIKSLAGIFRGFAVALGFAAVSAHGQMFNDALRSKVSQLEASGDYDAILKLVDEQETLWKTAPSTSYFRDMGSISSALAGKNDQMYWLGRKIIWAVLMKAAPREKFAAQFVYLWKRMLISDEVEGVGPYLLNVSPEMFASARHDTFLMLSERVRQLKAEIIPGYVNKPTAGLGQDWRSFVQNKVDNEVQEQDRATLRWLAEDQEYYLTEAYSHEPRDDEELKTLLDILNIQGDVRDRIIHGSMDEKRFWPNVKSASTTDGTSGK